MLTSPSRGTDDGSLVCREASNGADSALIVNGNPHEKGKRAYSSLAGGNSNFDKQKGRSSLILPHHPPLFHFCSSFLVYGANERWNSIT